MVSYRLAAPYPSFSRMKDDHQHPLLCQSGIQRFTTELVILILLLLLCYPLSCSLVSSRNCVYIPQITCFDSYNLMWLAIAALDCFHCQLVSVVNKVLCFCSGEKT